MKYVTEITIEAPRAVVLEKLDNPDNMKHWQRGLKKYEVISGTAGQEGAKMELHYDMGKRQLVLIETIIKNNLPDEWHATYDTKGVHNIQKNYFTELEDGRTKWSSESEFQFTGLAMKVMSFLMPGAFKKQSMKYAKDFKAFVEDGTSVADS